jgi:thioredoxin domain-containing protein 3
LIASKKSAKLTEDIAKDIYRDSSDKAHIKDLVQLMTSGETEIMVLSRENAIEGWREAIGPVDPKLAKEKSPHSYENKFIFLSLYYFL